MKMPLAPSIAAIASALALLLLASAPAPLAAQSQRIASDFEIARMEQQLASNRDFLSQLSGHLNLGDLRAARNESSRSRAEYALALDIAMRERLASRRSSELARYTTATSYAALANAKLGQRQRTFELLEESLRYGAGEARSWNLYATAMAALRLPRKATSAARNAVAIAAATSIDTRWHRRSSTKGSAAARPSTCSLPSPNRCDRRSWLRSRAASRRRRPSRPTPPPAATKRRISRC
jgi:hypothetical protein